MELYVKTPEIYISESGALSKAGTCIKEYGKKPLIIAGKTAWASVKEKLLPNLKENGISAQNIEIFDGYPSQRQFDFYAEKAREEEADSVIGIGGGRVLDTAKAVGDIEALPVIAIPTVGATCAAWAAVTIQYDDEGSFVNFRNNRHSAKLVIADTEVILKSPVRYLHSGIVDTFAKFYEIRPVNEEHPENIPFDVALYASKLGFDKLLLQSEKAESESVKDLFGEAAKDVVDSIIYIAGFAGSFKTELSQYSFAHPFYHSATRIHATHKKLHGEIVATGIVTQLVLEGKNKAEIERALEYFRKFGDLFSLSDLGLGDNNSDLLASIDFLSSDIKKSFGTPWSVEEIKTGLLETDSLIKAYQNQFKNL